MLMSLSRGGASPQYWRKAAGSPASSAAVYVVAVGIVGIVCSSGRDSIVADARPENTTRGDLSDQGVLGRAPRHHCVDLVELLLERVEHAVECAEVGAARRQPGL